MYQRVITPSAKKSLKRLPPNVKDELLVATAVLMVDPYAGERLHGSISFLFSFHFKCREVQYRVAYAVDEERQLVIIHLTGPRENFYDRLRQLFR